MRKKNEIFDRLAQSARARSLVGHGWEPVLDAWDRMLRRDPNRQRSGVPGTLEWMASDLMMPVDLLIEQFSSAGLTGLRGSDLVGTTAKDQLLGYLRSKYATQPFAYAKM